MSNISLLSPASTYPDLLQFANSGQGLNNTPVQIQDGLGNPTSMTISSNYINFDRGVSQFRLDGVALTASAATLNNLTDVANGAYLLTSPNNQLANGSVLTAENGISLTFGAGSALISPTPNSPLAGIQQLQVVNNGLVVYQGGSVFSTVTLVSNDSINIVNPDGRTGDPTFNVIPDTTVQRINVELNGVFESSKSQLNFIPGEGAGIVVVDNPSLNRTDITVTSTPQFSFNYLGSMYAATTANLNATYNNGLAGEGATLTNAGANAAFATDGVSPPLNSIILVKNQTLPAQNGIYTLTTVGSGAAAWVLTRAANFDSSDTIKAGSFVVVSNGTTLAGTGWFETEFVNVVGTDPIRFVQFNLTGSITSILNVHQVAHGLVVGNVIRIDSTGNYIKAQADSVVNSTSVVGIVTSVTNADNFTYQYGGIVTALTGLTVSGGYTTALPATAGQIILPLFSALSPVTAVWQPKLAVEFM